MNINKFNIAELLKDYNFAQSLSSNLMQVSVTSNYTNLKVDHDIFSSHIFFGNATRKVVSNINRIIDEYPIGISGSTTSNLSSYDVARWENWSLSATNFQQYIVNFLCGATGANLNPVLTASATSSNNEIINLNVLERDVNNQVLNLTAFNNISKLMEFGTFFDEGAERFKFTSGTGSDRFLINTYDYPVRGKFIPEEILISTNRGMEFDKMFPEIFFDNDDSENFKGFLSIFSEFFDSLKIYIDQFPNLFYIDYSGNDRSPEGLIQYLIAKQYGLNLFENVLSGILPLYYQKLGRKGLQNITYEIWNRILNDLVGLLKTKGTIEAFNKLARDFGIYNGFVSAREYIDNLETTDNIYEKNMVAKLPMFGQSFDGMIINAKIDIDWDFQNNNFDIDFQNVDFDQSF